MPTFPTYHGELPKCLNPLNPRHYFLLAYWTNFRPTALKCYLYQADPDLYRTGPGLGIFRTWRVTAYRNLYLMMSIVTSLISASVGLPFVLIISRFLSAMLGEEGFWLKELLFIWAVNVVFSLALCIARVVVSGVLFGVAPGVMLSLLGGAAGGAVSNMVLKITSNVAFAVAFAVVFAVAAGTFFTQSANPLGGLP